MIDESLRKIPGFDTVVDHFGHWPTFHDAEVVSVSLNRKAESNLDVHSFNMVRQVDSRGHYGTDKHATVRFTFLDVLALDLSDFNHQNVLSGLQITATEQGFLLELGCCFGLSGTIEVRELRLTVIPGIPDGSIYRRAAGNS